MAGWETHEGRAVHLPRDDVDTDQLIPARFMSVPRSEGYGDYLMHDLRRSDGDLDPDFPLNATAEASVLVAGRNFGCGSSREAAVYALVDAGFRAVVASGFGDIFAANSVNNGLCPARVSAEDLVRLAGCDRLAIDLPAREVTCGDLRVPFALQDGWAEKLVNGWDDIDLTLQHRAEIAAFRDRRMALPGARPGG